MERFVFIAAVTIAVLFGLGAMFGGPHMNNWHWSMDAEGGTAPVVAVAPGAMAAQTFEGQYLRLRSVAANVTIIPEDRADYSVEIDNAAGLAPMPTVSTDEGHVVIDGQLRGRIGGCGGDTISLRGYSDVPVAQLPHITIRGPRSLDVDRSGAGTTEIGATSQLSLDFSGCGTATVGDVAGDFDLDIAGAGELTGGAVGHLSADVAGSGDITLGTISRGAEVDLSGSATIQIASLSGDLNMDAAGSSNVTIRGGSVGTAEIDMAGSGDLEIDAPVQVMNVSIMGVGDIDVSGTVGDLDADIAGPGTITVAAVTGSLRQDIAGPGSVHVTGRGGAPAAPAAPALAPPAP